MTGQDPKWQVKSREWPKPDNLEPKLLPGSQEITVPYLCILDSIKEFNCVFKWVYENNQNISSAKGGPRFWVYSSITFPPSQSTIYMCLMTKYLSTNLQHFHTQNVDSRLNIGSILQSSCFQWQNIYLQHFHTQNVDSRLNIGSNLQSSFNSPPPK